MDATTTTIFRKRALSKHPASKEIVFAKHDDALHIYWNEIEACF